MDSIDYTWKRALAIVAGLAAASAGAGLNIQHVVEGGQPLVSPATSAIAALTIGAAAGAMVVGSAWRAGRKALASCIVGAVVCSELFGLVSGTERMLSAREERVRQAAAVNGTRAMAAERVRAAIEAHARAEQAALAEVARGGCGRTCRDLRDAAETARQQLEGARTELGMAGVPKSEHLLADTLGIDARLVEMAPALLFSLALNGLGFVLLAFGAESIGRNAAIRQAAVAAAVAPIDPQSPGRAKQVKAFVEEFRREQGRDPTFSEVRDRLSLPASTASTYLRRAVA